MLECRRGYVPTDEKEFGPESQLVLRKAQKDFLYLLEQGYKVKGASTFVGNHYMLSERQRLAIVRATAKQSQLKIRREKCIPNTQTTSEVVIDGMNVIITLEVALSSSTLIHCMDGTIRDLAGLRGTYHLIDKTDTAIRLIGEELEKRKVQKAIFLLDAPVSNTGRLKQRLLELFATYPLQTVVELVASPDALLKKSSNVITQDSIILDQCESWSNLVADILHERLPDMKYVELGTVIDMVNSM
jgi:hypothetical protein